MKYLLPEAAFNNIRARRIAAKYSHRDRVRRAQEAARIARHAKRFAPEAVHARVSARVVRALIKSAKIAMRHTGRRYTASGIAELREKAAAEAKKLCGPLPTVKIGTIRAVKRRRTFA